MHKCCCPARSSTGETEFYMFIYLGILGSGDMIQNHLHSGVELLVDWIFMYKNCGNDFLELKQLLKVINN
jgi:hypothetical protein